MDYLPLGALRRQLTRFSRQELADRLHAVQALSHARGLRFLTDGGRPRTIDLALIPWILTPAQLGYFRAVVRTLVAALTRLPRLYAELPAVRRILPFDPVQESWLRLSPPRTRGPLAVIGRMDSTATFSHANWRTTFQMLEPNAVGVGGVHYAPAACSVILDVLGDVFEQAFPGATVVPTPDPRQLLIEELAAVSRRLGRRLRSVALLENTDFTTGTDEFQSLARDLTRRGLTALAADPRDLRLTGGRLTARGEEIDLLYRDCELNEFIDMEAGGRRLTALRAAIQQGRLVSGLLWEFDQKSCWELFTDSTYARGFTAAQRRLFRAHVPWTRLVRQAWVSDPVGRRVDLVPYIRRHKDRLVLKPNTLFGGEGVVVGHTVGQRMWEQTLTTALRGKTRYVAQSVARIATERFPMLDDGRLRQVERSIVAGFFFNSTSVGLVGRFSSNPVVNVSRGGGLLSALMVS